MVHARGRFMQEAVPVGRGAMAAVIGSSPDDVELACEVARAETGKIVSPANYNSPGHTVISGDAVAVELACSHARREGAWRTVPLAVSAPFHCPLMTPAAEKLALELARVRFQEANPSVVTNVEAAPNCEGGRFPELLRSQVTSPVRFTEMVERMVDLGVTRFLEVGPGRVLTGLVARIARQVERANLGCCGDLDDAASFAAGGRARASGVDGGQPLERG
jgi:[acyl-carrier-protein] S-malonyltransferase